MRHIKYLLPILVLLCCGWWAAYSRNEIWYDLHNYHFYNGWAFLNGKTFSNYFVSGAYTFFAPLLDSLTYLQIKTFNNYPQLIFFMNGAFHGVIILIAWAILRLFIPVKNKTDLWMMVALLLYAITGYAYTQQIGSTTHEITCAIIFLTAFYLFVKKVFFEKKASEWLLFGISGLVGGVLGLKLTIFPMCVGFGALVLFCAAIGQFKRPIKALLIISIGFLIGFGLTDGWWLYLVWQKTGNPIFPMANHIFKSSLIPAESVRDIRFLPQTIGQWLFYPLYWGTDSGYMTEPELKEKIYHAIIPFICAIALTGMCLVGKIKERREQAVVLLYDVSYVVWLVLFSILRYAIVLEVLSGLMIFLMIKRFKMTERIKRILAGMLVVVSVLFPFGYSSFLTVSNETYMPMTTITVADDTIVAVAENLNSYVVPYIKTSNPVLGWPLATLTAPLPWDKQTKQTYYDLLRDKKVLIISSIAKVKQMFEKNPDLFPRQEINLKPGNPENWVGDTIIVAGQIKDGIWRGIDVAPGQTDRFILEMADQEKR